MKEDNFFWEYRYEPGIELKNKDNKIYSKSQPLVSIITSYYNANEFMWQTINCVLNQTFQSWEWIIVDDGSTQQESIEYLKKIEEIDDRIKIYHKQNEGLALGRDYAIKYSKSKYVLPLDADDLIEPTYIETLYFALETNSNATWAYTNSVGFGKYLYLTDEKFNSEKMKIDNHITATALIKKDKILSLGGYGQAKRYVNEDWHLWLRMLANGMFPVQVGFYGFWYRRRKDSLLTDINNKQKKEYEQKMKDLKLEADKIKKPVEAIIYPKNENVEMLEDKKIENLPEINILEGDEKSDVYILPYLGTDKKMYRNIKKAAKEKKIYLIIMQNDKYSEYVFRQKYEQFCIVYDLTTFVDSKYWLSFIQYVIDSRNIDNIYISNVKYKDEVKEKFNVIDIEECKHNRILYKYKILQYKIKNLFIIRAFRRIIRYIFKSI